MIVFILCVALQAISTIESLMVKIRAHNNQIRSMTPLTDHAAHIFTLLQFVGPKFQFHLSEFLSVFKEDVTIYAAKLRQCLANHHEEKDVAETVDGDSTQEASDAGTKEGVAPKQEVTHSSSQEAIDRQLQEVLETLSHTILEKASRYSVLRNVVYSSAVCMAHHFVSQCYTDVFP